MKNNVFICMLILVFLFSFQVFAHSGITDSNGGHHDNINGGYHYHHGYPAHQHEDGVCPYLKNNNKSDTKENVQFGFWGALILSVFVGWLGGALLLAILFFPLSLFFKNFFEERLGLIHLICSILVAVATFVFVYILN
jgi:hypothetical protein